MTYCPGCRTNFTTTTTYNLHRKDGGCMDRQAMEADGRFDLSYPVVRLVDTASRLTTERPDCLTAGLSE